MASQPVPASTPDLTLLSCDGCAIRNPGGPIGWGVVDRKCQFVAGNGRAPTPTDTNNIAELLALLAAIELHPEGDRTGCVIEGDSQYALYSVTRWYERALQRKGRTSDRKKRKNNELIEQVRAAYEKRPGLQLVWRRGHMVENELNALADLHALRLALEAAGQVAS